LKGLLDLTKAIPFKTAQRGTPEYDVWMAKRAEEAARLKTEQQPK
jgi:hypothetical protein